MAKQPVTIAIMGAGGRGSTYARFALEYPERVKVVGVAEPIDYRREKMVREHNIPAENVFTDWADAAKVAKFADAVVISMQDHMHADPAVAFADLGYHILLEKPMAPNAKDSRRIVKAVKRNGVMMAVCHVLRYTSYTRKLKQLLDDGAIGDVVSLQRLEPVGFWHMAHSFVRGHWHNEADSGFMLLTKSCHDLDWIRYIMGVPCEAVASFGSLFHFKASEKPENAADRCLDCNAEANCPYSAKRIYLTALERHGATWPASVIANEPTVESVTKALREGDYGRCVYAMDNDVVDHQVVNMAFEGGRTASFDMMAFTRMRHRDTRVFGTRGEITGDGRYLDVYDFLTDSTTRYDTESSDGSILGGHGGGDFGIMDAFVNALAEDDPSYILSGPVESLESHLMVFGAEQARREKRVVPIEL